MTRKGKIARLPRHIRDCLNRRLDDGEPSVNLVQWLNEQPDARRVLEEEFDGRPITEQNLSDWKQGGYLDWQAHQETREWVRLVAHEAEEGAEDLGVLPLSDRLSAMAGLALGRLVRDLSTASVTDSAKRDDLLRV